MNIYVGQIKVKYNYNPLGRYFNLWFIDITSVYLLPHCLNQNGFWNQLASSGKHFQ